MTEKVLLTVREYAQGARVTERTVRRWISEGRPRALRQGKKYLIPQEQSASAQLAERARPKAPGAAKPIGESALRYLLFWICDEWVDGGAALQTFAQDDPKGAERYFQNLIYEIDREAALHTDAELAVRLRFIARDLLANVGQPVQGAEAAAPSTELAPTQGPSAGAAPSLGSAPETMPLKGVD